MIVQIKGQDVLLGAGVKLWVVVPLALMIPLNVGFWFAYVAHQDIEHKTPTLWEYFQSDIFKAIMGSLVIPIFMFLFEKRFKILENQQKSREEREAQLEKEETEIRREVMKDFQLSFKDHVVLVDTFVAKIVIGCHIFEKKEGKNQIELSTLLPYGFKDLEEGMEDIRLVKAYFEFPLKEKEQPALKFASEFEKFEKEFFDKRISVTRFLSGLRLYYKNGEHLNNEFDKMWLRVMINHTLILKMMEAANQNEFVSLVQEYNKSAVVLFENMRIFDKTLGTENIIIERKKP